MVVAVEVIALPHPGGDEFFQARGIALLLRLARLDIEERARLDVPLPARRQLPAPPRGMAQVPAQRLDLYVHDLVMGVEQLDPVPVGIAQVDEQRVARPVPPAPRARPWLAISTARGCATTWRRGPGIHRPSRGSDGGCSQSDLRGTGGYGLFYCFASQ